MKLPRLVIAGSTSGVGKTSITCAIIFGLKKRGYSIQPFKVGPDYIDPSYLSAISKNETKNLDVWLMGKQELIQSFTRNSKSDISLGWSNKNNPLTRSSSLDKVLGVVSLFINKPNTVTIKITMMIKFLLTGFIKLKNGLKAKQQISRKYNI